jgi:hypothetical protein
MSSIDFLHKAGGRSSAEPRLGDIMSDPIMLSMMACDGVRMDALVRLIAATQRTLGVNAITREIVPRTTSGGSQL